MRVRTEGVFKMHSEDDDYNLPMSFQQRRHEQKIEGLLAEVTRNWRLKERVSRFFSSRRTKILANLITFR